MKKKVLVCGSSGFIGRNIAEHLSRRNDLKVYGTHFTQPDPEIENMHAIQADLRNLEQVAQAISGMDIVIQAAATTSGSKDIVQQPYIHVTDNAVMNSLILRSVYDHAVSQFIFFSCSVMYPSSNKPLKETDFDSSMEFHPRYQGVGWTKVYVEKMCEFYAGLGRTKHTVIRHSNIYGSNDKFDLEKSHVFGATMAKIMESKNNRITVWGEGKERRDFLFIDDLVEFVELVLQVKKSPFELVNVGSGVAIGVQDLVKTIANCAGKNITIDFDSEKPTINTSLCLDASKAFDNYKWKPKKSLEEGVALTMAWYIKNIDSIY